MRFKIAPFAFVITTCLTSSLYAETERKTNWYMGMRFKIGNLAKNINYDYSDYFTWFFDVKYRYFSNIFGGIGLGLKYVQWFETDVVDMLFPFWLSIHPAELRLSLWKKKVKSGGDAIVFFSGFFIDLPVYGFEHLSEWPYFTMVNFHLGFDIFWLTLGLDYENFIFEHNWHEIALQFGWHFCW